MSSLTATPTSSVLAATSSAATKTLSAGSNLKVVGVILAVASGTLIGSSFVFKKKGLLRSQAGGEIGEGVAYLKSPLWWLGMTMMIVGELCNFAAYAFVEAIVVTPLGALSVVICAILSSFFLNEKLSFFGWLGCGLCILGSVIIALNGPKEETIGQITEFQKLFLAPGFLSYISVLITISLVIVFYFAPKYGKTSMLWYISVCSLIGGISVSVTTGLGAAIVQTAMSDNQFKHWFMYFLFGFVIVTLLVEVYYLNVALALFNTAMVTPTYYVFFSFCSMVTTVVLFQGLHASVSDIITIVMAFLVICFGITILQMSKVDPEKLNKLDRRSTILLQAARAQTETVDEKGVAGYEDPGMDTLRGSFGAFGSIIRARTAKRMSQSSHTSHLRMRPPGAAAPYDHTASWMSSGLPAPSDGLAGVKRHQLYDAPVPRDDAASVRSQLVNKRPTIIKFDNQELVHSYSRPGQPQSPATHEHRQAIHGSVLIPDGYPPLPPIPSRDTVLSEGNLLGLETSDMSRQSMSSSSIAIGVSSPSTTTVTPGASVSQTISVPALMSNEHAVHSAPPTMYSRVPRPGMQQPTRKDSRDIFDDSRTTAGGRTTLLSFPSVTDSAPSQWGDEDSAALERLRKSNFGGSERSLVTPKEQERSRDREKLRTPKKYPKGLDDDDRAESESLWRDKPPSTESDDSLPPDLGSIRLVQPGSKF
ncbi:hypothetical protein M413DRAFT_344133 [Hebeloma cylindrosporum]|uniref:DUF803-domain-containing protein n=1 Tax=Hebeloma cylindrosporum TaxID=76867 RepID=A0A0C2Y6Z3_HEBCY|nr:hypothetical protein M413DRAFT_344133 [Hebeloma cylindrosporum h7]